MINEKYTFTGEKKEYKGIILNRIKYLRDIPEHQIKAGDEGGWVQDYHNLSIVGNCVVLHEAKVYGGSHVCNSACVFHKAEVFGNASVLNNSIIKGEAKVYGDAHISNNAIIRDNAEVFDNACIYNSAYVSNFAKVYESAMIQGEGTIYGKSEIYGRALVADSAQIWDNVKVYGYAKIIHNAYIKGDTEIFDDCVMQGYIKITGGSYSKAPIYIHGSKHGVSHSNFEEISIGCVTNSFEKWLDNYSEIGLYHQYTVEQIHEYRAYINFIISQSKIDLTFSKPPFSETKEVIPDNFDDSEDSEESGDSGDSENNIIPKSGMNENKNDWENYDNFGF